VLAASADIGHLSGFLTRALKGNPCWEDAVLAAFISNPPLPSSWNEVYLMLGSSSAALIGLLFVATSLHLAEIANEEVYRLRAQYTMLVLLSTLLESMAVLMPQPITVLGVELLLVSMWGLLFPITLLSKAIKIPRSRRGGLSVRRAGVFVTAYLVGFIGAGAVVTGCEWGMYGVSASYAILLTISIWNGWIIMQGIGRHEKESGNDLCSGAFGPKRTLTEGNGVFASCQWRTSALILKGGVRPPEQENDHERFQTPTKTTRFAFRRLARSPRRRACERP
jgi:hypothetical protein